MYIGVCQATRKLHQRPKRELRCTDDTDISALIRALIRGPDSRFPSACIPPHLSPPPPLHRGLDDELHHYLSTSSLPPFRIAPNLDSRLLSLPRWFSIQSKPNRPATRLSLVGLLFSSLPWISSTSIVSFHVPTPLCRTRWRAFKSTSLRS